jgi:hypothetical protein
MSAPSTIRCPACRVVLNIPPEAGNRRLRCPSCGTRFHVEGARTSTPGTRTARPSSSLMTSSPPPPRPTLPRPQVPGGRREAFDIPVLDESKSASPYSGAAEALFRDDHEAERPLSAAEARSRPRICPECTATVPRGMSLCQNCGLDLDTGRRAAPQALEADEDEEVVYWDASRSSYAEPSAPFGVFIVGGLTLVLSVALFVLTLVHFGQGLGGASLAIVCLFGAFASFQFLIGHSVRPLLIALIVGGLVDVVALIALPVIAANEQIPVADPLLEAPAGEEPVIPSLMERLETGKITLGVVLLIFDTVALIYLSTGGVRRHFEEEETDEAIPI